MAEKNISQAIYLKKEVEAGYVADAFIAVAKLKRTRGHYLTVDGSNTAAELR